MKRKSSGPFKMEKNDIIVYHDRYNQIVIDQHKHTPWRLEDRLEEQILKRWQRIIRKTKNLWSGPLVRLDSSMQKGDVLHLKTSITDYMHHVETREEQDKERRANPIYVSATITTRNNKLVFGLRSNSDRDNNKYNIAAGGVNPVLDSPNCLPSLIAALYREISEELGLIPESFEYAKPLILFGIESEPIGSFLYEIQLKIESDEVQRKLDATIKRCEDRGAKPEFLGVKFVENNESAVRKELETNGEAYVPPVRAMLKHLYGAGS